MGANLPSPFKRNFILAFVVVAVFLIYSWNSQLISNFSHSLEIQRHTSLSTPPSEDLLGLPSDYVSPPPPDPDFCEDVYNFGYLKKYRDSMEPYCDASTSISALTCWQKAQVKKGLEPFCVAEHVVFDPKKEKKPFQINCNIRDLPSEGPTRRLKIEEFPEHMFHTGPGVLLTDFFDITNRTNPVEPNVESELKTCAGRPKSNNYTILLKRDHVAPSHHWHSLWEIFSWYLSMDVLSMSPRNGTNGMYFSAEDIRNAQIVVLDDRGPGMMGELWNYFAKKPMIHLPDYRKEHSEPLCLDNVLLPIPGSANIIWTGDWEKRDCTDSKLVKTFVKRIMKTYGVTHPTDPNRPLKMTVISRKTGHRRMKNREQLVAGIRQRHPQVEVREINWADHPYDEQVRLAAETDIMIGMHGGGLVLNLFMPPGSSFVEIKPATFKYWGFRNMAKFMGFAYHTIHAEKDPNDTKGWQHVEEVELDEGKFHAAVDAAVHVVEQRGLLDGDIA
jgi:EGF domain-specific O-GlcNAc transferase